MRLALAATLALLPFAAAAPAHAVPGWSHGGWASLKISLSGCRVEAERAIRQVTTGEATSVFFPWGSESKGFVSDTGVFVYCMAHPVKICGQPSSQIAILAFSDKGWPRAAQLRDAVRFWIGNPVTIDCG
jgi:hypothetical protein